jgi:hypothetical protein
MKGRLVTQKMQWCLVPATSYDKRAHVAGAHEYYLQLD